MTPDTAAATLRSATDGALIDELYGAYTAVVDGQEWHRWPELFAEECSYAVYSLDNVEQGLPLAYMLDDSRARLLDRVKFVTEVWAGTVEPYRTRHITNRFHTEAVKGGLYAVRANFIVSYTEADGRPGVLATGYYQDRISVGDGASAFEERNVYLDGTPARYLVYPL